MKILVIGDTHGKLDKVRDIYPKLTELDLIAHTGDHLRDARALARELQIPVIGVKGNCDGSYSKEDFEIIETEYGKLLLTHGHMEGVNNSLTSLLYKAQEQQCRAVLFGHTHKAFIGESHGVRFVNPGSLSQPRDNTDGSYAVVRTSETCFDASIVYYSTIMGGGENKKPRGGFVRNLLNYSDRF